MFISAKIESMRPSTAVAERCRSSSAATRATLLRTGLGSRSSRRWREHAERFLSGRNLLLKFRAGLFESAISECRAATIDSCSACSAIRRCNSA